MRARTGTIGLQAGEHVSAKEAYEYQGYFIRFRRLEAGGQWQVFEGRKILSRHKSERQARKWVDLAPPVVDNNIRPNGPVVDMNYLRNALPSQTVPGFVWVREAGPLHRLGKRSDDRTGKWMVFLSSQRADELWPKIKHELRFGSLSICASMAKISFSDPQKPNSHVLVIYTPDFQDKAQVAECLFAIRSLGVVGTLYYKTNEQTRNGIYSGTGKQPWIYNSDMFEIAED